MQVLSSVDIEDTLRQDLTTLYATLDIEGVSFSAPPVPPTLGELPATGTQVCLTRVGGGRSSLVVDSHTISIDVYDQDWQSSLDAANLLAGVISQLPFQSGLLMQYHAVSIDTLPYALPDTSNPVFPRVRMLVTIIIKSGIMTMPED